MECPLQITFHNMPHSDRLASAVEGHLQGLESLYGRITSCRVVIDVPHRHHESGNLFNVRIDLRVPGHEIVVNREPGQQLEFKDPDAALSHAFDAASRQLEDFSRQQRAHIKHHEPPLHARVVRLLDGFGFLQTPDEREIYFHRNSLVNGDFGRLAVGTEVIFVEELGDKGPQASTVKITGRHSHL